MGFSNPNIPFPPIKLDPGSCQAVRIAGIQDKPIERAPVSPEWRAEQDEKQRIYQEKRAARRKEVGIVDVNY
jgi:hypothetical protein